MDQNPIPGGGPDHGSAPMVQVLFEPSLLRRSQESGPSDTRKFEFDMPPGPELVVTNLCKQYRVRQVRVPRGYGRFHVAPTGTDVPNHCFLEFFLRLHGEHAAVRGTLDMPPRRCGNPMPRCLSLGWEDYFSRISSISGGRHVSQPPLRVGRFPIG